MRFVSVCDAAEYDAILAIAAAPGQQSGQANFTPTKNAAYAPICVIEWYPRGASRPMRSGGGLPLLLNAIRVRIPTFVREMRLRALSCGQISGNLHLSGQSGNSLKANIPLQTAPLFGA